MKQIYFIFIAGAFLFSNTSYAECNSNSLGIVYCSRYSGGGAITDNLGIVHCGKGQCLRDNLGIVHCSAQPGGSSGIDNLGMVRCVGGCEIGSPNMCVMAQF